MRHPELLLLVACAGCNTVFGVTTTDVIDAGLAQSDAAPDAPADRDRDGIPDIDDSCINSVADGIADYEGDSYANATDGCPFDYEMTDSDSDTVYDHCDPFVALAGDRRRCIMAFQNPVITRELMVRPPGDQATWYLLGLSGLAGQGTGTLVAAESFEAPATTTYDLLVHAGQVIAPASEAAVTLWIRTNQTPAATDVGCQIRGNGSSSALVLAGGPVPPVAIARAVQGAWKLSATIEPSVTGRANIRCIARSWTTTSGTSVSAEIVLPPGTVGFGIEATSTVFAGLMVIERDDAPPL